ncbi:T3SS effector HopA1 family protein [Nonomuraea typhae]|uniref:T3SS effector HopA1 family protein n=1 Tax=Nonomuraea typhae TaxID=2603600 RepID=A0ABW7Z592_9ACTN
MTPHNRRRTTQANRGRRGNTPANWRANNARQTQGGVRKTRRSPVRRPVRQYPARDSGTGTSNDAIRRIYDAFGWQADRYGSSTKLADAVYDFAAEGRSAYRDTTVDADAFRRFIADAGGAYTVEAQGRGTVDDGLRRGDYFYVSNPRANRDDATLKGKARRVVVNVKSQAAALRVSERLAALFQDNDISPYFRTFKTYFSGQAENNALMKFDKIVAYYARKDGAGADDVGNSIVTAIRNAMRPGDADERFAPFYERLHPGIAWSHEPKYYTNERGDPSFSESRMKVVARALMRNPRASEQEFRANLRREMIKSRVDPDRAHRQTT